jgi:cobalamin biosynthesis protein CobT
MGTPEQVMVALGTLVHTGGQGGVAPSMQPEQNILQSALDNLIATAVAQALAFDAPSWNVEGVRWLDETSREAFFPYEAWSEGDEVSESVLGSALLRMRTVFSENDRTGHVRNLKSGRVNGRVLGRRVFLEEPRLFEKKRRPKKRSYFVVIGLDVSGSTASGKIRMIKSAAYAKAELLSRLGITFAVYAHSSAGGYIDLAVVKSPDEPWSDGTRTRLKRLKSFGFNLDGHTLEQYRKVAESRPETHKVIMYYTDGEMPASNYDEELLILQSNIDICKKKKITLIGVGIGTDSPVKHGLDTVRIDKPADIPNVVKHLEGRLLVAGG